MAGLGGLDEEFVEAAESSEAPAENINVDPGSPKLPPRWRQIEMMREKRALSDLLESYDEWEFDDSEEE